jgi:hypothetical protein
LYFYAYYKPDKAKFNMETKEKQANARKWTVEKVNKYLDAIEREAKEDYCFFIRTALAKQGLQRHVWSYWKRTFAEHDDLIERMYVIDTGLEAKLLDAGLKELLPAQMVSSMLKMNYGWCRKAPKGPKLPHPALSGNRRG